MSKVLITRSKLDNLAVAVSAKSGATLPLTIAQMQTAVENIPTGGGFTRTVVAQEQTVTSSYRSDANIDGYFATVNIDEPLEEHSVYIVTFDDDEYYATGILMWGVNISLGIESYFWNGTSGTSYSIPFGILYGSGNTCTLAVNSARTISIKIEKLELF